MQEAGQVEPTGAVPAFLDFTRLSALWPSATGSNRKSGRRSYDPNRGYDSYAA
jgi:hypothetical protein